MNPKPLYAGLLACIIIASCHTSQSTTYTKPTTKTVATKPQTIQLPNLTQELQVEVVTEDNKKKGSN